MMYVWTNRGNANDLYLYSAISRLSKISKKIVFS